MDRPLTLSPVPLLLVSLVWTLVDLGPHGRFADAAYNATPINFREVFIGGCEDYQQVVFPNWIHEYVA